MHTLTLDEKITIKGLLARKSGFSGIGIINGTLQQYIQWFDWCYGKPIQFAFNARQWHKGHVPAKYIKRPGLSKKEWLIKKLKRK